jgi:hypothetical protein
MVKPCDRENPGSDQENKICAVQITSYELLSQDKAFTNE